MKKSLKHADWTQPITQIKRVLSILIALPMVWALFHIWSLLSLAGWR